MLTDNTSAENYYLSMPFFSSGIDLLANTIADLILRKDIVLLGSSYLASLNCNIEEQSEHEKLVLEHLKEEDLHIKRLVYLTLASTTKKEFKSMIFSTLKHKGLMKLKYFLTSKGRKERRVITKELKWHAKTIERRDRLEIIETARTLGGNVYLLNDHTKLILKDIYPWSVNIRRQVMKFMGVTGMSDSSGNLYSSWGVGFGDSYGYSGGIGFSGGGGGDFGGGGAGGSW
jgi:uncharacterized membrane protein YgcG